jgi:sulfonate transport system permease protein
MSTIIAHNVQRDRKARPSQLRPRGFPPAVRPFLLPALLLAAWECLAHAGVANPIFFPTLEQIAERGIEEARSGDLLGNLAASLERDLIGFVAGGAIGTAFGLIIGFSPLLRRLFGPTLLVHRQIALFAWVPLISMWFGGGETGKLVFIALAAFQPALVNSWQGVANIPHGYRELSRVMTYRWFDYVAVIALPGALPSVFTGLHTALIYAWTATVGAELLLNVSPGLGGRMNEGQHLFHMDLLLLCLILLGLVGVLFNLLAARVEHRLVRWRTS